MSLLAPALVALATGTATADVRPARTAVTGDEALEIATRLGRAGPRPAAGHAEGRAHALMQRAYRRAGLRVAVQRFATPRGQSRNVIGVLDTRRSCLRVVMAHADSAIGAPGADDNGSGVGVLAELAPRLRRIGVGCDVWLVATGAEERIVTGSRDHLGALALARRIRARGLAPRLRFALSLDEVGTDSPFWLRSPARRPRPAVEGALLSAARRAGSPIRWVPDQGTGNSDHREFALLAMPAAKLGVGAGGEPCRHMPCDGPGRLRRESLAAAVRIAERALRAR